MSAAWITQLVRSDRELHDVGGGLVSALGAEERDSPYDRQAGTYDHLVGNRLYNRLVWRASPASYAAFAAAAVSDSMGPCSTQAVGPRCLPPPVTGLPAAPWSSSIAPSACSGGRPSA